MVRLIIILTIIATICVTMVKPQMHKPLFVYNSDYKIVPQTQDAINNTPMQEIPTINQQEKVVAPDVEKFEQKSNAVFAPPKISVEKISKTQTPTVKMQKNIKTSTPTVVNEVKTVPQSAKTIVEKYSKNQVSKVQEPVKTVVPQTVKQEEKVVTQPKIKTQETISSQPVKERTASHSKPVQTQTQTVHLPAMQPTKTAAQIAKEEEIAWNKWRSRLQNQIMADVRMPNIPYGVIFKFSFTVDKYGKISNVQTWSTTPNYTPHAIQYIAPVIRSYQGRSILNFPSGSNRVTTEVVGAWKISNSSKYSTPQDYNDTERVTR